MDVKTYSWHNKQTMFEYFFTYGTELPDGVGFPMFGTAHLIWLLIGTAAVILLSILYYKRGKAKRRRMDLIVGCFLLFLLVIREVYLYLIGFLTAYELPIHLCSLAGILCFIHSLKNFDGLGQILFSLCLPGTIVALIFPDWLYYPPIHFITVHGFVFHFGVALYVVCQLISRRICPDIRRIWKVFVFLAIAVIPIYFFNRHYGTNYFFINAPAPGSPLEWMESVLGNPGYLFGYGVLAVVIPSLLTLLYMAFDRLAGKRR